MNAALDPRLLLEHDAELARPPDFDLPPIPFGRTLKLTMRGNDVRAVKRALHHAGYGTLAWSRSPLFGPVMLVRVKQFQQAKKVPASGVYGAATHHRLDRYFDPFAFLLYTGRNPNAPAAVLQLPYTFTPDHPTAGLPGYPARDFFAKAGATIGAPADGVIVKLSGHSPSEGGVPGGAYGWSAYLQRPDGAIYYMTHWATRAVELGQRIHRGDIVGTVCDARVAHMPTSLSHCHMGLHGPGV